MKKLFANIKGDAFGGLTAGIVALPLALAFGVSSGLGPSAGLYGAIFISFFAALFGGTATQISGPTAPMTAVSIGVVAGIVGANEGNLEKAIPAILTVFLLAGLFQVLLGVFKLGKYIRYIPYPVVSGFMTAIGLMIILTNILPLLGYYPQNDAEFVEQFIPDAEVHLLERIAEDEKSNGTFTLNHLEEITAKAKKITQENVQKSAEILAKNETSGALGALRNIPRAAQNINWLELILALGTILIIYGFKRITTAVPSTLVALIIMSGIAAGFGLDYYPIDEIPSGLPIPNIEMFTAFNFGMISPYIFTAITLAVLGAIDSLLTSVVADNMTKTRHKPNQELIGQGIGNSIAGIFGGLPGAGATIRTVVNIQAGGKTKLSGMIAGVILLVILLGLGPVASKIPAAVLAGILITVGIGVMDYKGLKAIPSLPKDIKISRVKFSSEVMIMIIVLILSTFWNLINAVGIGLIMASLIFMKKIGDLTMSKSDVKSLKEETWKDEINFPENLKEEVFIKHLKGPLFFGTTSDFQLLTQQIPGTASHVILRLEKMDYMDQSGLYALEDMLLNFKKNNIEVLLVNLMEQPRYLMEQIDIIPDMISEEHIFDSFDDCTRWIKDNVEDVVN